MSKVEKFEVGQVCYQAQILVNGRDVEGHEGDYFTSFEEACEDGRHLATWYDPEWQKRNPDCAEHFVRRVEILELDDDGSIGYAVCCAVSKADAIADEIDNAIRQSKELIGGVK